MNTLYLLLGLLVLLTLYAISVFNFLQTALTRITASVQEIGNQLKRQASLIPNLETAAKAYLKHEKDIYKSLTDARTAVQGAVESGDLNKMSKAADKLSAVLPKLQIMVESNPELKAEKVVVKLMDELRDTSDKLTYARRVVIDLSADFNQKLVTFPSNIIAGTMGFKTQTGLSMNKSGKSLEVSDSELEERKISL